MTSTTFRTVALPRAALALAACLLTGLSATAFAALTGDAPPSVRVSYQDLNLATEQGTQALYARIERAAHKVCTVSERRELSTIAAARNCEAQAIERAVRSVNSPRLAALYSAHQRHG